MNLNVDKILIIGLGMIGSSIALASKSKGIKVYGFDKSNNSIKEALEKKGVTVYTFDGDALCIGCEGGPTCLTRPILRA